MNRKELIKIAQETSLILKAKQLGKLKPEAEARLSELYTELDQINGSDLFIQIFDLHMNPGFRLFNQLTVRPEKYLS